MIEELKRIVNKIDQFDISRNDLPYLNALVFDLQNIFKSIQTIYGQVGCCISMDKKIFSFKDFINKFNSRNKNDTKGIYQKNNPDFIEFINNKKNEFVYKIKNDINMLEQEVKKRKIINDEEAYPFSTDTQPIKLPKEETKETRLRREREQAMRAFKNIQKREFIGGDYNLDQEQEKNFQEWKKGIDKYYKELHEEHMLSNQQKHIIELPKIEPLFRDDPWIKKQQIKKLKKKNIDDLINAHNQVLRPIYQQQMDLAIKKIEKEAKEVGRRVYYKQILQKERNKLNNRISNFGQSIHDNNIVKQHIDLYRQQLNNYNNRPQHFVRNLYLPSIEKQNLYMNNQKKQFSRANNIKNIYQHIRKNTLQYPIKKFYKQNRHY